MPVALFSFVVPINTSALIKLCHFFFKHCVNFFSDATYQKMLVQLAQCEFAIGKTQTVFEMNELETENYEKIYREIGKYK